MTKHTILFLAANPSGTDLRALDLEARSIGVELKRTGYRDRFEFETRWAAEPLDLLRALRELKPTVVHFSGRGGPDGLWFQDPEGGARSVSAAAIAEAFGAAGGSVRLVVLSACYGDASAEALLAHVDCVIGTSGALHEDTLAGRRGTGSEKLAGGKRAGSWVAPRWGSSCSWPGSRRPRT